MKQNEKDVFLLITNKCSLRCFSCAYGCEDKDNDWFITKDEFITILNKIKNTNIDKCTKYSINLTGGDPLLHKDWKELAFLTKKILPDCICYISTSGPLLLNLKDNVLIDCYKNNIRFGITLYPSMKLLQMYQTIEKKFLRLGISDCLTWNSTKFIFGKPCINKDKDIETCFNNHFTNADYCFIFKNNLYNCQNLFYQDMKTNMINSTYHINDICNYQNLKNVNTKKDCQFCKLIFYENVLWHFNDEIPNKCLFTSLKDLFLYDYKNYYLLQHDCKEHLLCLNNDFFKKYTKEQFIHPIIKTRFLSGIMDIFIPFDNYISEDFEILLKQQKNLDKCNLYFISYTDNIDINSKIYENFYSPNKNIFFLRASNYLNSIHIFLYNSYLNKKYCLDINNFNCLKNINFLNQISEEN